MIIMVTMAEPIIHYEDGMHIDGILSYGAYRDHVRQGLSDLPPITDEWAIDFDLPLERWERPLPKCDEVDARLLTDDGLVWGWCGSRVEAEWISRGKMEYRKKPDCGAMQRYTKAGAHHLGAGPFKAFDVAYPTLTAEKLRWCAIGDVERVRCLLSLVTHIGKKSTTGMGAVQAWSIEPCDSCPIERRFSLEDGWPGAIRPPYHHMSRRVSSGWGVLP